MPQTVFSIDTPANKTIGMKRIASIAGINEIERTIEHDEISANIAKNLNDARKLLTSKSSFKVVKESDEEHKLWNNFLSVRNLSEMETKTLANQNISSPFDDLFSEKLDEKFWETIFVMEQEKQFSETASSQLHTVTQSISTPLNEPEKNSTFSNLNKLPTKSNFEQRED